MGFQFLGNLPAQGHIHLPGQQQLIDRRHQPQPVPMAELAPLQAEVNVGSFAVTSHRPGAEQPHGLQVALAVEHLLQPLLDPFRDAGD